MFVDENPDKLSMIYWLHKLHQRPYNSRFNSNSSLYTTIELSILLTSCLTTIENNIIKYCEKVYEGYGKNYIFWSINISVGVLNLK